MAVSVLSYACPAVGRIRRDGCANFGDLLNTRIVHNTLEKTKEAIVEAVFFVLLNGPVVALQGVVRQRHTGRNGGVRPVLIAASGTAALTLPPSPKLEAVELLFREIIAVPS